MLPLFTAVSGDGHLRFQNSRNSWDCRNSVMDSELMWSRSSWHRLDRTSCGAVAIFWTTHVHNEVKKGDTGFKTNEMGMIKESNKLGCGARASRYYYLGGIVVLLHFLVVTNVVGCERFSSSRRLPQPALQLWSTFDVEVESVFSLWETLSTFHFPFSVYYCKVNAYVRVK